MLLIGGFYFDSRTLLFWFDLFLEARSEILEKISLIFWEIWRHQKDIYQERWLILQDVLNEWVAQDTASDPHDFIIHMSHVSDARSSKNECKVGCVN